MQNSKTIRIILVPLLFFASLSPAYSVEDPLKPIRHLANLVYLSCQDMVVHGDDGHLGEIIEYGNTAIKRAEALLKAVEEVDHKEMKAKKGKLIASVKGTLEMVEKAIVFGERKELRLALAAARKASFRAKQTRQRLKSIR